MASTRKPKALLDAEKKIAELEKKISSVEQTKDMYYKLYNEEKAIADGLHDVLDDLGVRGIS